MSLLDRAAVYVVGKCADGWTCASCGSRFDHHGNPRRTFLTLLDHVVLDHRRLPAPYSKAVLTTMTAPMELSPIALTYSTASPPLSYTLTGLTVMSRSEARRGQEPVEQEHE